VVLLDARTLVVDMQRWRYLLGQNAGAKAPERGAGDPAVEHQLDLLGVAEIEVLADHLLTE